MKKWLLGILCLAVALICGGCGSLKMDTFLKFNPDESGEFKMQLALDGVLAGFATSQEGAENFDRWDKVTGVRVREYDHDDKHIFEVTLPFDNPAQLEQALGEMGYTVKFRKRSSLFYDRYQVSFAYPQEFIDGFKEASTPDEDTELLSQEELENVLNTMFAFKVNISLPGKITTTDAPIVEGQLASWTQRPRQLKDAKPLVVSSQQVNWLRVIVLLAFLLWVIGKIQSRLKKAPTAESFEQEQ